METIRRTGENFSRAVIEAAEVLAAGGVVVAPTDTVYGLLANASDPEAVKKLYRVKSRDANKPVPIFVKDLVQAKTIAIIEAKDEAALSAAWPGKTTFILTLKTEAEIYGTNGKTVALRIPDHPYLSELMALAGAPLCATSANISGKPAQTAIGGIIDQFKDRTEQPDLVIDAGDLPDSKPSTIIDLTGAVKKILRP